MPICGAERPCTAPGAGCACGDEIKTAQAAGSIPAPQNTHPTTWTLERARGAQNGLNA